MWPDSASRGDTPLGAYEDPYVKVSASVFTASGLQTFLVLSRPPKEF